VTLVVNRVQVSRKVDTDLVIRARVEFSALVLQDKFHLYHSNQMRSELHRNSFYLTDTRVAHINPLNPELNPICYFLALLAHHFPHVSRTMAKSLTLRLLMSYIYIYIYIYILSAYS